MTTNCPIRAGSMAVRACGSWIDRAGSGTRVSPIDRPASDWPFGSEKTPERTSSAMTDPL